MYQFAIAIGLITESEGHSGPDPPPLTVFIQAAEMSSGTIASYVTRLALPNIVRSSNKSLEELRLNATKIRAASPHAPRERVLQEEV